MIVVDSMFLHQERLLSYVCVAPCLIPVQYLWKLNQNQILAWVSHRLFWVQNGFMCISHYGRTGISHIGRPQEETRGTRAGNTCQDNSQEFLGGRRRRRGENFKLGFGAGGQQTGELRARHEPILLISLVLL